VTVAQISEFSLILAALGLQLHHISNATVGLITAVGVITITLSTYLIIYADGLFRIFQPVLSIFERRITHEETLPDEKIRKRIVLVGFHRTGRSLAQNLQPADLLVVDFDPDMIKHLDEAGLSHLFGDITDPEIFDKAITPATKFVISTSPDLEDNLTLAQMLKQSPRSPRLIVRAETEADAEALYRNGAAYVVFPNLSAGNYLGKALAKNFTPRVLQVMKAEDLKMFHYHKN
jgi:hypothetical protein